MYHRNGLEAIGVLIGILIVGGILTAEYIYAIVKMLEVMP